MKKLFLALVVLLVSCSFVFAGGSAEAAESSDDGQYKVALIIENTIDDRGWCQSMHEGILGAMEQLPGKIHYEYSERMTTVDSESIARQYIADGFDLIIAHGAQYKNMVSDLAAEFPDVSFAFGTSSDIVGDNVFTYMPESEETGYLSGLLAGMLTKKNNIGFVGPVDSGDAARYARGFVLGVKEVNPAAYTASFVPREMMAVSMMRTDAPKEETVDLAKAETTGELKDEPVMEEPKEAVPEAKPVEKAEVAKAPEVKTAPAVKQKMFHIIIASFPNEQQADEYISTVDCQVCTGVDKITRDGKCRVYAARVDNREEAERYQAALRKHEKYKDAWLFISR